MTSLDISSVRDFSKPRLRRMLTDFYGFVSNPIGPPDPQKIELGAEPEKLIALTNRYLFRELADKEHNAFARQSFEKPNTFLYVKLLNANKFAKKVGNYLIEFRVVRKRSKESRSKKSSLTSTNRSLSKSNSKTDLRWPKADAPIFRSKTAVREPTRPTKISMDKVKALERKMRYGFDRRTYSEQSRKSLSREIFQQSQTSLSVISRTSEALFPVPPNWTYCSSYELKLNKTVDPTGLFLEIDVRLIEFLDINPKQAKIVKTLPLSDLLADQFLDVVIIKDVKRFYQQMIESTKCLDGCQAYAAIGMPERKSGGSSESTLEQTYSDLFPSKEDSKCLDTKEYTVMSSFSEEKILRKPGSPVEKAKQKSLLARLTQSDCFKRVLFAKNKRLQTESKVIDLERNSKGVKVEPVVKSSSQSAANNQASTESVCKSNEHKPNSDDRLSISTDSTRSTGSKSYIRKFLNLFKPTKVYAIKKGKKSDRSKVSSNQAVKKKQKTENTAFLSIELQLGAKIELSREKRLISCLNHIDAFVVLALEGKKSFLNLRELRSQTSWHHIYTPEQIFILNQSKMHQTISALEDAICRTIAIAKIYAKYARIKNFCYLNSSVSDLLYQYSLSSKQQSFNELSQLLEDYLFENLETIFKAEMPASLMAMYKYNYSKYGEFLFDQQVQLILGVLAIKRNFDSQPDYVRVDEAENAFANQESEETFKNKTEKRGARFAIQTAELSSSGSISEQQQLKENRLISSSPFTNAGLNLLSSMAKGFERCAQVWMQYMETKKPEGNLEELVNFSRALKNFCTGLVRIFNRKQHLLAKRLLSRRKKDQSGGETMANQIARKYSITPRLPRPVTQSMINLHLIIDSKILSWIPFSLRLLVDKLMLPVDYDEATDVAKRNAIFQASPYKDIYNSLRVTVERLQSLHNEQIQAQVNVQKLQGWFPLNVTQAWVAEEIQRVEVECVIWEEFFKELSFIKSDFKLDKMEKLNLITDKEKQMKEKEFKDFLNDYVANRLQNLVESTLNEISYLNEKNDLLGSKFGFLTKTSSEQIKVGNSNDKLNLNDAKNLAKIKTLLNEPESEANGTKNEPVVLPVTAKEFGPKLETKDVDKSKASSEKTKETKEAEQFKEPTDQIKHELDKLIKSQSIASQLADKLIMSDERKERTVASVLESLKKDFEKRGDPATIGIDKSKLEDRLKEELEKIKLEKELEEREKRKQLEEKIQEEFNGFKQGKSDRFNKRLQKFSQLKPIELIRLMESCYENLIAFVSWPHAIFPAKTAKEIVYCIDLIAVVLKRFYQKLEQKGRSSFESVYKSSLERFIVRIRIVNYALMENSFVDPDLRMNVVEWTEYQERSWRGMVISLECSKQINKFCILNETKADRKLRMLPRRKLIVKDRKRN